MNTQEQFLAGLLGFLAVAGIVVLIVLMVKKKGHHSGHSPGPAPGPAPVRPCTVSGGHGVCTSGINTQRKMNCVGGDQLCGVNLAAHEKNHKNENSCDLIFNHYHKQMINCDPQYQAYYEKDNQGNCLFKCKRKK